MVAASVPLLETGDEDVDLEVNEVAFETGVIEGEGSFFTTVISSKSSSSTDLDLTSSTLEGSSFLGSADELRSFLLLNRLHRFSGWLQEFPSFQQASQAPKVGARVSYVLDGLSIPRTFLLLKCLGNSCILGILGFVKQLLTSSEEPSTSSNLEDLGFSGSGVTTFFSTVFLGVEGAGAGAGAGVGLGTAIVEVGF